jgi:predicted metal-binding membrane protein
MYELTPLKERLRRRCRLHDAGGHGPIRSGLANGVDCVGCCLGLMTALFALGVMSIVWMAAVGAVIFAEKVLPNGGRVARIVGVALVALGLWVAVSPSSVPGLTEPDQTPAVRMEM